MKPGTTNSVIFDGMLMAMKAIELLARFRRWTRRTSACAASLAAR